MYINVKIAEIETELSFALSIENFMFHFAIANEEIYSANPMLKSAK